MQSTKPLFFSFKNSLFLVPLSLAVLLNYTFILHFSSVQTKRTEPNTQLNRFWLYNVPFPLVLSNAQSKFEPNRSIFRGRLNFAIFKRKAKLTQISYSIWIQNFFWGRLPIKLCRHYLCILAL